MKLSHRIRRVLCALLAVFLASQLCVCTVAEPAAAAPEAAHVLCMANSDLERTLLTVYPDASERTIYITAADAAQLCVWSPETDGDRAVFSRNGRCVSVQGRRLADGVLLVPMESCLAQLEAELELKSGVLFISARLHDADEIRRIVDPIIDVGSYTLRDMYSGAVGKIGKAGAALYRWVTEDWGKGSVDRLTGQYLTDLYHEQLLALFNDEEGSGLLSADVLSRIDYTKTLSAAAKLSGLWDELTQSREYLEAIDRAFFSKNKAGEIMIAATQHWAEHVDCRYAPSELTKLLKTVADPVSYLVETRTGLDVISSGIDLTTQIKVFSYLYSSAHVGLLGKECLDRVFPDSELRALRASDSSGASELAEAVSVIRAMSSDDILDKTLASAKTELSNIFSSAVGGTLENMAGKAIGGVYYLAIQGAKLGLKCLYEELFNAGSNAKAVEKGSALCDIQTAALDRYEKWSVDPDRAVQAKWAAILYLRCYEQWLRVTNESDDGTGTAIFTKEYRRLLAINDRDLEPFRPSDTLSYDPVVNATKLGALYGSAGTAASDTTVSTDGELLGYLGGRISRLYAAYPDEPIETDSGNGRLSIGKWLECNTGDTVEYLRVKPTDDAAYSCTISGIRLDMYREQVLSLLSAHGYTVEEENEAIGILSASNGRIRIKVAFDDTGYVTGVYAEQLAPTAADEAAEPTAETVTFGRYAGEDIEWEVLEERPDGTRLLISTHAIEVRRYHDTEEPVTWEDCSLRAWLNGAFYREAFSAEEQARIVAVTNENAPNETHGTYGGNATVDRVWLLSLDELCRYYSGVTPTPAGDGGESDWGRDERLVIQPTRHALDNGAAVWEYGGCWWWLRSPGREESDAAAVYCDGSVPSRGILVTSYDDCVRPMILVSDTPVEPPTLTDTADTAAALGPDSCSGYWGGAPIEFYGDPESGADGEYEYAVYLEPVSEGELSMRFEYLYDGVYTGQLYFEDPSTGHFTVANDYSTITGTLGFSESHMIIDIEWVEDDCFLLTGERLCLDRVDPSALLYSSIVDADTGSVSAAAPAGDLFEGTWVGGPRYDDAYEYTLTFSGEGLYLTAYRIGDYYGECEYDAVGDDGSVERYYFCYPTYDEYGQCFELQLHPEGSGLGAYFTWYDSEGAPIDEGTASFTRAGDGASADTTAATSESSGDALELIRLIGMPYDIYTEEYGSRVDSGDVYVDYDEDNVVYMIGVGAGDYSLAGIAIGMTTDEATSALYRSGVDIDELFVGDYDEDGADDSIEAFLYVDGTYVGLNAYIENGRILSVDACMV